jgi:signal transduction histidine kinase
MAKHKNLKRKQILVEKKMQMRFARFVLFFAMTTAFLTSTAVFFTTMTVLGDKLEAVYPQGRLGPIVRTAYLAFFLNLGVAIPVLLYFSIKFSHRIVGPLPKIYKYLAELGEGHDPGTLVLRDRDELQDLAVAINNLAEKLKSRGITTDKKS